MVFLASLGQNWLCSNKSSGGQVLNRPRRVRAREYQENAILLHPFIPSMGQSRIKAKQMLTVRGPKISLRLVSKGRLQILHTSFWVKDLVQGTLCCSSQHPHTNSPKKHNLGFSCHYIWHKSCVGETERGYKLPVYFAQYIICIFPQHSHLLPPFLEAKVKASGFQQLHKCPSIQQYQKESSSFQPF